MSHMCASVEACGHQVVDMGAEDIASLHPTHQSAALALLSLEQLQAVLSQLDRPLLCTSAHVEEQEQLEIPEAAMFIDLYAGQGLDFVVDTGQRVSFACRACSACIWHCSKLLYCYIVHVLCFSKNACMLNVDGDSARSSSQRLLLCSCR